MATNTPTSSTGHPNGSSSGTGKMSHATTKASSVSAGGAGAGGSILKGGSGGSLGATTNTHVTTKTAASLGSHSANASSSASAAKGTASGTVGGGGGGGPSTSSGTKSLKKTVRKKRKPVEGGSTPDEMGPPRNKVKKLKRKKEKEGVPPTTTNNSSNTTTNNNNSSSSSNHHKTSVINAAAAAAAAKKKARKQQVKKPVAASAASVLYAHLEQPGLSPAQIAVNEQMRKALEEDQYSANGSIVDTDTDDDDHQYVYKGHSVRLDRSYLLQAARKYSWLGSSSVAGGRSLATGSANDDDYDDEEEEEEILSAVDNNIATNKKSSKASSKNSKDKKKRGRNQYSNRNKGEDGLQKDGMDGSNMSRDISGSSSADDAIDMERDEGSIFGQTTGASNATWVECDKCKKWRRLRGVVDERKLPPKWYCSMNKNDPERARCSAPEEEYDAAHTPESAADARTRKHLRVWVRRLQCNEQYESRQPTLTRGKKRAVASSSKEPHEWIRCCNPSCGKWRAVLRIMDAKQNVIDRTTNGEWYCVMNTWDEKTASCAAPQENLPAVGCPPWVMQDEN